VKIDLPLNHRAAALIVIGAVSALCIGLSYVALSDFVRGALLEAPTNLSTDAPATRLILAPFARGGVSRDTLQAAVRYYPNSSRLQLRLAQAEAFETGDGARAAEFHAMGASRLSPYDYRPYLMLSSIERYINNLQAAEHSARQALRLAPGDASSHWELAMVLLQQKHPSGAFEQLRLASAADEVFFPSALETVWSASGKNVDAARAVTPDKPKDRLALARFLLKESRPEESAAVFRQIDPQALLANRDSSQYLNSLVAAGHIRLAHDLWRQLVDRSGEESEGGDDLFWNGGFESDIPLELTQFDWTIQPSDYARISIDSSVAHRGKRSLRIDFLGRDTTRLEDDIKQLTVVRPDRRYRLSYYVKTDNLAAPESARVTASNLHSHEWIAASPTAPTGTTEWQFREFEFTTSGPVLVIAIKQRPRFSYEDPTRGSVWFDDFELRELR
jgi:hypothetical protein